MQLYVHWKFQPHSRTRCGTLKLFVEHYNVLFKQTSKFQRAVGFLSLLTLMTIRLEINTF